MYQQLAYLNLLIGEGPISSNIFGLADTCAGLNMVNLDKFVFLKYLNYVGAFNISGLDGGK